KLNFFLDFLVIFGGSERIRTSADAINIPISFPSRPLQPLEYTSFFNLFVSRIGKLISEFFPLWLFCQLFSHVNNIITHNLQPNKFLQRTNFSHASAKKIISEIYSIKVILDFNI